MICTYNTNICKYISQNPGQFLIQALQLIQSAFDKVWHDGLIYKLYKYKIPLYIVSIITDYLNDRKFTVKIDNHLSSLRAISCSVPQGGVLSPTLFSLFINDLPLNLSEKRGDYSYLFADDIADICFQIVWKKYRNSNK